MKIPFQTVVELSTFIKASSKLFTSEEIADLIVFLATNPDAGDVMKGTGGFRKLRWARQGIGKRGGSRVIYFWYNKHFPLFLYTAYAKNELADLSQAERNQLAAYAKILVAQYGENHG